jgi:hypothetical protein
MLISVLLKSCADSRNQLPAVVTGADIKKAYESFDDKDRTKLAGVVDTYRRFEESLQSRDSKEAAKCCREVAELWNRQGTRNLDKIVPGFESRAAQARADILEAARYLDRGDWDGAMPALKKLDDYADWQRANLPSEVKTITEDMVKSSRQK